MASNERQLVVKFVGDTKSLNSAVSSTSGPMNKLSGSLKAAGTAFAGLAVAGVAADFLGDATKAAEEDKKSQEELARQLKVSTGATEEQIAGVEKYIGTLSRVTGVADDDLRPAYEALARASGDTETAQNELGIAMDIAAARGVDLAAVTTALEKAHNGNIGALGRLGVATKDAEGNTLSLTEAMAGAAKTYEGAAEAAVTPGQRMSVAFQELKEQIGTALLPVLENLSTFMADTLLPAFQNAIVWIQENWPEIENAIRETFDRLKPMIETFVGVVKTQFAIVKGVFTVISDLLHGDWSGAWTAFGDAVEGVWKGITQVVKAQVGVIIDLIQGLITGFRNVMNRIIDLWNSVDFTFEGYDIPGPGPNIPGFTIGLPDMPHLDTGGTVLGTGMAVVHKGETVIPAGTNSNVTNNYYVTVPDPRGLLKVLLEIDRTHGGIPVNIRTPA